jgi:hypothetical protein
MPLYRVIVRGRNFRLNMAGKCERFGFCAPRIIRAADPVLAKQVAVEYFCRSAEYLYLLERSVYSEDDHPVICGEEIVEVLQLQELEKAPAALTFYKERCNYDAKRKQDESRLKPKYKRI